MMLFNFFIWIIENPPVADESAVGAINDSVGKFQIPGRLEREGHSYLSLGNQFPNRVIYRPLRRPEASASRSCFCFRCFWQIFRIIPTMAALCSDCLYLNFC